MPVFGNKSKTNLATCDQRLQDVFNEVIKTYDCTIIIGHRTKEDQEEAYHAGRSKVRWPNSKHNSKPSKAVDVAPWFTDTPHIRWEDKESWYHFGGYVRGIAAGMDIKLRWGGDWDGDFNLKDQNFMDLPHFEIEE